MLSLMVIEGTSLLLPLFCNFNCCIIMSETEDIKPPKVLRFLNDYRKKLSLLKIRSFYANHLCKRNCLQGNLNKNNESCLK